MRRSVLAATVAMVLLFGITALAHSPQLPTNTPTPTPPSQDLRPQGAPTADENDEGDINVEDQSGDVEAGDTESGDMETGDTQSGDSQAGDSQSGAQQDGEFEGDN